MDTSVLAAQLRSVPSSVGEIVVEVDDARLRARPIDGDGEWSAIEVVGHLVDKFVAWQARMDAVIEFDGPALDPYDQDECVRAAEYQSAELNALLGLLSIAAERFARAVEGGAARGLATHGSAHRIRSLHRG